MKKFSLFPEFVIWFVHSLMSSFPFVKNENIRAAAAGGEKKMVLVAHSNHSSRSFLYIHSDWCQRFESISYLYSPLCLPSSLLFIPPSSFFHSYSMPNFVFAPPYKRGRRIEHVHIHKKREDGLSILVVCVFVATHSREEGLVRSAR